MLKATNNDPFNPSVPKAHSENSEDSNDMIDNLLEETLGVKCWLRLTH